MTHKELVLEHYGVKGMKWGVRRYKQDRAKATSSESKHMVEKKKLASNTETARHLTKQVGMAKNTVKNVKRFTSKRPNSRIAKGVESLADKNLAKKTGKLEITNSKIKESKAIIKKEKAAYTKAVRDASKLPIGHYGGRTASFVKPFLRDMALISLNSNYMPKLEKTANDRFDENVKRYRKDKTSNIRMRK